MLKEISWHAIHKPPVCSLTCGLMSQHGRGTSLSPCRCPVPRAGSVSGCAQPALLPGWGVGFLWWVSPSSAAPMGSPCSSPSPRGQPVPPMTQGYSILKSYCINHNYVIFARFPTTMNCSQICTICEWITGCRSCWQVTYRMPKQKRPWVW